MKSGIQYEQGEIVLAPFPFTDLSSTKQRPVLIISNNNYNEQTHDIVTCGITSNIRNAMHSIGLDSEDLTIGVIPTKSRIKVDKVFTLNKPLVIKKIAKINENTLNKVKQEFQNLMN
tara:strand:- start:8412 stop:8762 length:351 start_codon:yes stop_codon:yes gene_type:complete